MSDVAEETGPDPLIGTLVGGKYRVSDTIGRGGMGVVYDAVHAELGKAVAIKVVSSQHSNDVTVIDRFMREARLVSQIGHPNIVGVYDLGRLDDRRPYLVMERLVGENFYDMLDRDRRYAPLRVVMLLSGVAAALEVVHAKGVVHRDIKLENLMLCKSDDGSESVKLLDFGIAAFSMHTTPDAKRITAQGMITGTPLYIAPEAAAGERPDHRADVYSLAVVAFMLLTGTAPFDSENPVMVLVKKMSEKPPRLSTRTIAFSDELERVIARGLARDPDARYPSARAFIEDLEAAAHGGAVPDSRTPSSARSVATDVVRARDVEIAQQTTKIPSHERPKWRFGVWALGVGLGVAGAILISRAYTPKVEPIVVPVRVTKPLENIVEERVQEPVQEPEPPPQPKLEATPEVTKPVVTKKKDPPQKKVEVAVLAEPIVKTDLAQTDEAAAVAASKDGMKAMIAGRYPQAIESFIRATRAFPKHAPAWKGLGLAYKKMGQNQDAIAAFGEYLRIGSSEPAASISEVKRQLDELKK